MRLEEIGFYTLCDKRAVTASHMSPFSRCELILTSRCNFNCPYCRHVGGNDISFSNAFKIITQWAKEGLKNIRLSGGEPTLYKDLDLLVKCAKELNIERIAISTNGSASKEIYENLIICGVNDFSISLDACCAEDGDKMAGGFKGSFDIVTENIKWLSKRVYTTVGVVLTEQNMDKINEIIEFADTLGVSDIRIIPAAQTGNKFNKVFVDKELLLKYPILKYRIENIKQDKSVRGIKKTDSCKCGLVLDDMAVCGNKHYPCIIYMREGGDAIGEINETVRQQRKEWYEQHNTHCDSICKNNCLDVCVEYNNKFASLNKGINNEKVTANKRVA